MLSNIRPGSDEKKSRTGIPYEYAPGQILYVRQAGGHNYIRHMICAESAMAEYRELHPDGMDAESWNPFLMRIVAEVLIDRWEGFEVDGAPADYTPELGVELFSTWPEGVIAIYALANNAERFTREADTKSH